jgi:hypothetical protein
MRVSSIVSACAALGLCAVLSTPAHAVVPVAFGSSWDPPAQSLQNIVDGLYGVGSINVHTDYIGAKPGDLDPWFWIDNRLSALLVREVAGNANNNLVGWYEETGSMPVIDGVGDGVIFSGPSGDGTMTVITFDRPMTRFGFYLNPNGPLDVPWAPEPEKFFTNRLFNERGPNGTAIHAPFDGDVQALVFDVSEFTQPNTWLVCFEDLDAGSNPAPCCYPTDNDFNDVVFEVTAFGATPTVPMTIGALKAKYLK